MTIDRTSFKHLNIEPIQKLFNDLNDDHTKKMLILNDVFIKIYEVLVENNIDIYVFNDMKCSFLSPTHLVYAVTEKTYTFSIHLHLEKTKKLKPHGRFVLKNNHTQFTIEEILKTSAYRDDLPAKFILYFTNSFPRYYKSYN